MIRRRERSGSALAFIDVMACGLGAVLLLFVLLDFEQAQEVIPTVVVDLTDNTEYDKLTSDNQQLRAQLESIQLEISSETENIAAAIVAAIETEARTTVEVVTQEIQREVPAIRNATSTGDLVGLQIKGSRILIMLDSSASMAEEELIDVLIGVADKTGRKLKNGIKWAQAMSIVEWIAESGPQQSRYQLITYSDKPTLHTQGWVSAEEMLTEIINAWNGLAPTGATNLELALDMASKRTSDLNSIYIITDGLPTQASTSTRLRNVRSCGISVGRGIQNVSGECREALFEDSIKALNIPAAVVNVVLLPFEGDPMAAPHYWQWAVSSRGRIFSPDQNWP
tara:strand:+ start:1890 stop:2906 length:1017 start_codon:yes stop_codon:yes gene_type:complete